MCNRSGIKMQRKCYHKKEQESDKPYKDYLLSQIDIFQCLKVEQNRFGKNTIMQVFWGIT